jgi:hypothetical protein
MKYYLATGLLNAHRAQLVRDHLNAAGHEQTYDWTAHGPVGHKGKNALIAAAVGELEGVQQADVIIALLPGGRGTHAELGMALALGKPVLIWDETCEAFPVDDTTCAFYWHPLVVQRQGDVEAHIKELRWIAEDLAGMRVLRNLLEIAEGLKPDDQALVEAGRTALKALQELNSNYGEGLGVAGWHRNGDIEPLDVFIEEWGIGEAIAQLEAALPKEVAHG